MAAGTPMTPDGRRGWWTAEGEGEDYGFVLDGDGPFPDPRSPWQPDGVHGLSRAYDHGRFAWTDGLLARDGRSPGASLYELHIGTFTPEGTFDSAIRRLDHLVDARRGHGRADAGRRLPRPATAGGTTASRCGRCTSRTAGRTG